MGYAWGLQADALRMIALALNIAAFLFLWTVVGTILLAAIAGIRSMFR